MPESDFSSVVPAQLSFLAIYNPSLGPTDETIHEQVVFYTSRSSRLRRQDSSAAGGEDKDAGDDMNERLRQIGLAQGMVSFARNFSEGKAVDYVETEKSQIVLHELEKDWWILASVDLTRLPTDRANGTSPSRDASEPSFHYSSREMSPPQLLIQQLRRAHYIFLLHHASSLDDLYSNVGRSTFCIFLESFWLRFAWNWEALLSGNPAVEMYNGVKLSAGGELGIGVGEEEWGSGEREVLEDFVSRTDGLVDLVVSRFGDPYTSPEDSQTARKPEGETENQWLGSDAYPRPPDGVIFSGVGAITRQSLVHVSQWMEGIYRYGTDAYGVGEDPLSARRQKRRKRQRGRLVEKSTSSVSGPTDASQAGNSDRPFSPGIPRPLVTGTPQPRPSHKDSAGKTSQASGESSPAPSERGRDWVATGAETFVKYITLGYGSSWGFSRSASPGRRVEGSKGDNNPSEEDSAKTHGDSKQGSSKSQTNLQYHNRGRFLIGLQEDTASPDAGQADFTDAPNEKITKRTLHLRLADPHDVTTQLRVVVYIHQPFIYTFLFTPTTPSLEDPALYHSIHHQLGPLQKSLSTSTSPATAVARIPSPSPKSQQHNDPKQPPVYDLVYDPSNLTIRSSIPNIPDLTSASSHQQRRNHIPPEPHSLSRIESINIHHRLLTTYIETRSRPLELERTAKTNRGWWVIWLRILSPSTSTSTNPFNHPEPTNISSHTAPGNTTTDATTPHQHQEAFLVRQASDHVTFPFPSSYASSSSAGHARTSSGIGGSSSSGGGARFFRDLSGASSPGVQDMGPGKLVEGLGIDARRYIEGLLNLNR